MLGQTLRVPNGRRNQAFPYIFGWPCSPSTPDSVRAYHADLRIAAGATGEATVGNQISLRVVVGLAGARTQAVLRVANCRQLAPVPVTAALAARTGRWSSSRVSAAEAG